MAKSKKDNTGNVPGIIRWPGDSDRLTGTIKDVPGASDVFVEQASINPEYRLAFKKVLAQYPLHPNEQTVIEQRFFPADGQVHTFREIGEGLGLSGSRVEQIEKKAIRKLQYPTRVRALRAALDELCEQGASAEGERYFSTKIADARRKPSSDTRDL